MNSMTYHQTSSRATHIAGSHASGPEAARADLFQESVCVISPSSSTDATLLDLVAGWWRQVGARVISMPADSHDEAVALTSHLPHLVSAAVVELLMSQDQSTEDLFGSGFKDFSRIAAGDAKMWRNIFVDNLDNLRIGSSGIGDPYRTYACVSGIESRCA